MLKKFLLIMGLVFTGLVGSCIFMVGGAAINASEEAPQNKAIAAAVTRDLARAWDVSDIKSHFVNSALSQINFTQAQQSINSLKALGPLRKIESAQQTSFQFSKSFTSTSKSATIVMVAEFDNGRATVTVQLANEGSEMKLMHVSVTTIGDVRTKKQQA